MINYSQYEYDRVGSGTDDRHMGIVTKSQIKMSVEILKKEHNRLNDEWKDRIK